MSATVPASIWRHTRRKTRTMRTIHASDGGHCPARPARSYRLAPLALLALFAAGATTTTTTAAPATAAPATATAPSPATLRSRASSPSPAPAQSKAQAPREPDLCVVPPGAQPLLPAKLLEGMGVTDMPVTTSSADARRFFNQGVSQLHSFWAIEAERSFLQAATLDPDMAMAWWGIAISAAGDHRPAFQLIRDVNDGGRGKPAAGAAAGTGSGTAASATGRASDSGGDATVRRTSTGAALDPSVRAAEAIERARALRDKVTPRERLYIDAQWARRNRASKTRDADYIAAMRRLVVAHPDDDEAKSILGLALLDGFDPISKEPRGHTVEGLRMLDEIVARHDDHFGAHHYLIHGWEGSATPQKAWRACERYPQLVTNIPHALHMPGHIYAQSGRVADAVTAFAAASENEQGYLAADVLYPNGHHGHNVHFLVHALNLDGRYQESLRQVQHLLAFKETPREREGANQRVTWRQGYFALVKTLVRFERWDDILDGRTLPVYDRPEQQAWRQWAVGLAHSAKGHAPEAQQALAALRRAVSDATATQPPLQIAAIELEATIAARGGGDRQAAYTLFRQAADREARLTYTEPPAYPRPVAEGWALVAGGLGDQAVADEAWREALAREPGSGRAYFGRAAALDAAGRRDDAREALTLAERAWARADRDLPQWRQVKSAGSAASPAAQR